MGSPGFRSSTFTKVGGMGRAKLPPVCLTLQTRALLPAMLTREVSAVVRRALRGAQRIPLS